jgi:hypothetical protein
LLQWTLFRRTTVASLLFADNSKLPDFFMRISMASQEGEITLRMSDTRSLYTNEVICPVKSNKRQDLGLISLVIIGNEGITSRNIEVVPD